MTVARAMVLKEHLNGKTASQRIAEQLGISRQTRHNWLKPESVAEWTTLWEARLKAAKSKEPSPKKKQERITEAEWRWIALVLANSPGRSWGKKQQSVAYAAGKETAFSHLRGISRVTLFRNRAKLVKLGEEVRQNRMITETPSIEI